MMQRNLDGRVELVAPVEAPNCVARVTTILSACLADDTYAWHLAADGTWTRSQPGTLSAQRLLHEHALHAAGN